MSAVTITCCCFLKLDQWSENTVCQYNLQILKQWASLQCGWFYGPLFYCFCYRCQTQGKSGPAAKVTQARVHCVADKNMVCGLWINKGESQSQRLALADAHLILTQQYKTVHISQLHQFPETYSYKVHISHSHQNMLQK